jgi:hypothetical protein
MLRSSQVSHDAGLMTRDAGGDAMYIHKHLSSFLLESFSADLIMTIGTKSPLKHSGLGHETSHWRWLNGGCDEYARRDSSLNVHNRTAMTELIVIIQAHGTQKLSPHEIKSKKTVIICPLGRSQIKTAPASYSDQASSSHTRLI